MRKSFYGRNFALTFQFLENGDLFGMIKVPGTDAQEFTGIYVNCEHSTYLCFELEWKCQDSRKQCHIMFYGHIKKGRRSDFLELKWMQTDPGHHETSFTTLIDTYDLRMNYDGDPPLPKRVLVDITSN